MNEQIQQRHLPSINNRGLAVGLSHKLYELLLKICFSMEKIKWVFTSRIMYEFIVFICIFFSFSFNKSELF